MSPKIAILGLAYINGILFILEPKLGLILALIFLPILITYQRKNYLFNPYFWFIALLILITGIFYCQWRLPQPKINDISHYISQEIVTVTGKVLTQPRITKNERFPSGGLRLSQFWLTATTLETKHQRKLVTGKLYATIPLEENQGINPQQQLSITGILYRPKTPINPSNFDFAKYLKYQGAFAGIKGLNVEGIPSQSSWGLWVIRQRIIHAQSRYLPLEQGKLISSIILGRQAVDLPEEIEAKFIKIGLAHILAVSGFQIALLLGFTFPWIRYLSPRLQFTIILFTLIIYVGLTGIQPSIMRAAIMGIASFIPLTVNRQTKSLFYLLLAAIILLIVNPLWLVDLSFQFSFLATLGLITLSPKLEQLLDFLISPIATTIGVTLAASLWTLPLSMSIFATISIYSILVNIITTPLTIVISIVGMISALASIFFPLAGSAIAFLLYYPSYVLIAIVTFFINLPGSYLALGKIPLLCLIIIYGLLALVTFNHLWRKRWHLVTLLVLSLIIIPIIYRQVTLIQVTVFAIKEAPIIIIQDTGKVTLINSGNPQTVEYTILPFLAQQGINNVDCAINFTDAKSFPEGWQKLAQNITITQLFTNESFPSAFFVKPELLSINHRLSIGATQIHLLSDNPPLLTFHLNNYQWLLAAKHLLKIPSYLLSHQPTHVLLWQGKLNLNTLHTIKPQNAIALSDKLPLEVVSAFKNQQIQLFWTKKDGAIQWQPQQGFKTFFNPQ